MTSTNRMILSLCADGYAVEIGTGTSKTAVTYDIPFDSTPIVLFSMTATGSGNDGYFQTSATNTHTLTTTTAKAYNYVAWGPRKKRPGR